jgi:outer membrane protein TolC
MRSPFLPILWLGMPLAAQTTGATDLALRDAVRLALEKHPSVEASAEQGRAAAARIQQARSGYLPRFNYSESFQTSNNPVFAFGALLNQRRFTEQHFAIDSLNRPGFIQNFQSQLGVEFLVYDFGGGVNAQVRSAELGHKLTREQERLARMGVIAQVARTYHGVVLAAESLKVAQQAVASAEADLARAEAVRNAGMSTDADVLSIRVHLAAMKEREIERRAGLEVSRAALNEALGLPLDTAHTLTTALATATDPPTRADLEKQAPAERPETRQAALARELAESQSVAARSALYPKIVGNTVFEADRGRFVNQGGANWWFGVSLRWNLFNGGDRPRIEEASHAIASARAREREAASGVQLEIRQAHAAFESARQRIEVASAAVAQAEESLRITKNRYDAGLTTVTDLLRNETAALEARTRRLAAIYDQRIAAVLLELAAGTLSGDSNVLQ